MKKVPMNRFAGLAMSEDLAKFWGNVALFRIIDEEGETALIVMEKDVDPAESLQPGVDILAVAFIDDRTIIVSTGLLGEGEAMQLAMSAPVDGNKVYRCFGAPTVEVFATVVQDGRAVSASEVLPSELTGVQIVFDDDYNPVVGGVTPAGRFVRKTIRMPKSAAAA